MPGLHPEKGKTNRRGGGGVKLAPTQIRVKKFKVVKNFLMVFKNN